MAPHLTLAELDFLQEKQKAGKTPIQIHSVGFSAEAEKDRSTASDESAESVEG